MTDTGLIVVVIDIGSLFCLHYVLHVQQVKLPALPYLGSLLTAFDLVDTGLS